jgi:beta-N-acetylhexosaminidase
MRRTAATGQRGWHAPPPSQGRLAQRPIPAALATFVVPLLLVLAACAGQLAATEPSTRHAPAAKLPTLPQIDYYALDIQRTVNWQLAHMTLDEKLGQLFLIETVWQHYNSDVDNMVRGMHAGAMIVYNQNISDQQQLHDYLAAVQAHASLPLLISTDEEGGLVDRLAQFMPSRPSAQDVASSGNPTVARQEAAGMAQDLLALGINADLAPVVDVRTTPAAVEYTRLFGDDPATVDRFAGAFLDGVQQNGVVGCLKHWPGIGSVTLDPHETLPTIDRSLGDLQSTEFAAFKNLLGHQPGMIMVTHVIVSALDPNLPATLSPKVVDGVLRGQLGYQGVVMTDSLYMKGISVRYSLGEAAVLSIIAGDDLLEGAWDTGSMQEMFGAIKQAMAQGRISAQRIDQSVARVLTLKARYGLIPLRIVRPDHGGNVGQQMAAAQDADLPRSA